MTLVLRLHPSVNFSAFGVVSVPEAPLADQVWAVSGGVLRFGRPFRDRRAEPLGTGGVAGARRFANQQLCQRSGAGAGAVEIRYAPQALVRSGRWHGGCGGRIQGSRRRPSFSMMQARAAFDIMPDRAVSGHLLLLQLARRPASGRAGFRRACHGLSSILSSSSRASGRVARRHNDRGKPRRSRGF